MEIVHCCCCLASWLGLSDKKPKLKEKQNPIEHRSKLNQLQHTKYDNVIKLPSEGVHSGQKDIKSDKLEVEPPDYPIHPTEDHLKYSDCSTSEPEVTIKSANVMSSLVDTDAETDQISSTGRKINFKQKVSKAPINQFKSTNNDDLGTSSPKFTSIWIFELHGERW